MILVRFLVYKLLLLGSVVSIASGSNQPELKGCGGMLVKESKLRKIAESLKFNRSGGHDFVLFVRENNFVHWRALRLLVQAEVDAEIQAGRDPEALKLNPKSLSFWMRQEFWDLVMGDPHLRNLESRLFPGQYGFPEEVRIVFNDPDDAGVGPLFGDLLRLGSVSLAEKLNIDELVKFYSKGLAGTSVDAPKALKDFLSIKPRDFLRLQKDLLENEIRKISLALSTQSGNFNFNHGAGHLEVQTDIARIHRLQELTGFRLLSDHGVPEAYRYTKKGGGSGGIQGDPMVTRDWLLVYNGFNMPSIVEFKPLASRPGVSGYNPNQERSAGALYAMALKRMYAGRLAFPEVVPWMDGHLFMRDKLVNPLKDAIADDMSEKAKGKVASFAAHLLGDFHSRNLREARILFLREVLAHKEEFRAVFELITHQLNAIMSIGFEVTPEGTWNRD